MRFVVCLLIAVLSMFIVSCSKQESPDLEYSQSTESVPDIETTNPTGKICYSIMTDEELLRSLIQSRALEMLQFTSAFNFPDKESIQYLTENYPEFAELYQRDTMLETLNGYGAKLAESYLASSDAADRFLGLSLQDFIYGMNGFENQ